MRVPHFSLSFSSFWPFLKYLHPTDAFPFQLPFTDLSVWKALFLILPFFKFEHSLGWWRRIPHGDSSNPHRFFKLSYRTFWYSDVQFHLPRICSLFPVWNLWHSRWKFIFWPEIKTLWRQLTTFCFGRLRNFSLLPLPVWIKFCLPYTEVFHQ